MTTVYFSLHGGGSGSDAALRLKSRDGDEVALSNADLIAAANTASRVFYRSRSGNDGVYLLAHALTPLPPSSASSSSRGNNGGGVRAILPTGTDAVKLPARKLLLIALPTILLFAFVFSYVFSSARGFDAVFPSSATAGVVIKITVWLSLMITVAYEHVWFWTTHPSRWIYNAGEVKLQVTIEGWASDNKRAVSGNSGTASTFQVVHTSQAANGERVHEQIMEHRMESPTRGFEVALKPKPKSNAASPVPPVDEKAGETSGATADDGRGAKQPSKATADGDQGAAAEAAATAAAESAKEEEESDAVVVDRSIKPAASSDSLHAPVTQELPPPRFIKAEKGDILAAQRRYSATLAWRKEMRMDTILAEPHPNFAVIKKNYPHFYHLRGRNNEPCYYESPPKMKLQPLREAGVTMDDLLRHYAMTCEFMWTHVEPSEEGKSIYVIDLEGIGIRDFAGDVVDFVKRTSAFTSAHYPERSGSIFVINVPSWFSIIWNTVKPWVDEVTRQKIKILRSGAAAITKALEEKVAIENIPPEYGGKSMPLGQSPEEIMFREKIAMNNKRFQAKKDGVSG